MVDHLRTGKTYTTLKYHERSEAIEQGLYVLSIGQ
jgi:hypothetical protein